MTMTYLSDGEYIKMFDWSAVRASWIGKPYYLLTSVRTFKSLNLKFFNGGVLAFRTKKIILGNFN